MIAGSAAATRIASAVHPGVLGPRALVLGSTAVALGVSLVLGAVVALSGATYQKVGLYLVSLLVALVAARVGGPEWLAVLFLVSLPFQVLYPVGDLKVSVQEVFLALVLAYTLVVRVGAHAVSEPTASGTKYTSYRRVATIICVLLAVGALAQTLSLTNSLDADLSRQSWPAQVAFPVFTFITFTLTTRWARSPVVLLGASVLAGALYALLTLYTYVNGLSFDEPASTAAGIVRAGGEGTLLPPSNLVGGALGMTFGVSLAAAMLLRFPVRLLALPALGIIGLGIVLTYSRGSWVATAVGALVVLWFAAWRDRGRTIAFAAAFGLAIAIALAIPGAAWRQRLEQLSFDYVLSDTGVLGRFAWWDESFRLFLRSPLIGSGLDGYVAVNPWGTHNHWLELLAGVGLAGTLPVLAILVLCVGTSIAALRVPHLPRTLNAILVASVAAAASFGVWTVAESVHSDRRIIAFVWAALGMGLGAAMRAREGDGAVAP